MVSLWVQSIILVSLHHALQSLEETTKHIHKDSIEQRWKNKISKLVMVWKKIYRQLKSTKPSRWNEDNYIEEAGNLFKAEVGKPFKHAKCVLILHSQVTKI